MLREQHYEHYETTFSVKNKRNNCACVRHLPMHMGHICEPG